jgi:hypothetical protein
MQNNHVVIMAGGVGSRFWPMSTPEHPKQFIDVLGCGRTLLQLTVDRFSGLVPISNFWVVTSARYKSLVEEQLPDIPRSNILLEPCMRNTAPCIAYAAWKIKQRCPEANIVVTSSDHMVTDVEEFRRVITKSLDFTATSSAILTLGMKPTRPETGYGYIAARPDDKGGIKSVEAFKEKPSLSVAEEYLRAGNYFWNAGIFIWNIHTLEQAFRSYCPGIASIFDTLSPYFYSDDEQAMLNQVFPTCENISIDYAVMEKASDIYVFPASFGWSDLGTWGSLHTQLPRDNHNNACVGDHVKLIESENCIVHVPKDKRVVVQGLDGYIIAENNGTLLICKLRDEQRIKEFSR